MVVMKYIGDCDVRLSFLNLAAVLVSNNISMTQLSRQLVYIIMLMNMLYSR